MRVLVVDDDPISRHLCAVTLIGAGHNVVTAQDGKQAWQILSSPETPRLVVLDWMMPFMDGVELCRKIRQREGGRYMYLILLTAKARREDVVTGLDAGADDYVTKPCNPRELRSRVKIGERILQLEEALETKIEELGQALAEVKKLQGLLPICMHCKRIRDGEGRWHRLEAFIEMHSEATFSHSLCNACLDAHYPQYARKS